MAEPVFPFSDGGQGPFAQPGAASVAHEVNGAIRDMAESLDDAAHLVKAVAFLCECGCLAFVEATVAEYDAAGGAWLGTHEPPEAR